MMMDACTDTCNCLSWTAQKQNASGG